MVRASRWCTVGGLGTIGYVLVGYPLVVITWSRLKGETGHGVTPLPELSIIVSAHNEAAVIGPKLASIAAGDYPVDRLQVIVSDDGSTDGTVEIARAVAPWAEVVENPRRTGKMGAMRRGMSRVRHEVVVFTDAENRLEPASLTELVAPLSDPAVGAVNGAFLPHGGAEVVSAGERLYWRYEDAVKRAEANVGSLTSILGALLAIRTELVPELPAQLINDDFYLGMHVARAGLRVAYAPRAQTSESGAASLQGDAARRSRMTAGRWQTVRYWREILPVSSPLVMWQVLSHKYLRLALPFAMGAAVLGSVSEVTVRRSSTCPSRWATSILLVQVGGYGLAIAADGIPRSVGPLRSAAQAAKYLVRTNLAAAEGFWTFLTAPESLTLWERVDKPLERP
jgi:cellulose synthase/poly-beta-1,6-N-acetylglucosamine synthase-like glycosyltransferase